MNIIFLAEHPVLHGFAVLHARDVYPILMECIGNHMNFW